MAHTFHRRNRHEPLTGMFKKVRPARPQLLLAAFRRARPLGQSGAYSQYVSTAKGRERRWRLFSIFPYWVT
ncbi:MAG: hypothetical protein VST67_12110 [Nitrospirota bacterium]|nr:hypothetical protein [Nitrospirota bacterium]